MEDCSLHLLDLDLVRQYAGTLSGATPEGSWKAAEQAVIATARQGYASARQGRESGANVVSYGLGQLLAMRQPSFALQGASLTPWEARIDRGAGMLMRPPSRLFIDAGLDPVASRAMPIRLELSLGMMGGAWIPARLIPELQGLLESRMERHLRRMIEAELDAVPLLALMMEAADTAAAAGMGLFEAMDVIAPDGAPPGARVAWPDRKRISKELRTRLDAAAVPPKEAKPPGRIARLFGRGRADDEGQS